jgi:hypothetical protein
VSFVQSSAVENKSLTKFSQSSSAVSHSWTFPTTDQKTRLHDLRALQLRRQDHAEQLLTLTAASLV